MDTKNKSEAKAQNTSEIKADIKKEKQVKKPKKKKQGRRVKIIAVVAVVAIVLVAIVVNGLSSAVLPVIAECAYAETGDVQVKLDSSGTIATGEEKTYFAPVSSEIEEVYYQVGDVVSAGDLLVKFDQDDIDYQYQTAQLNGTASQYTYLDAVNQSGQSSSDKATLESEIASLKKSITSKESEIANLESSISGAAGTAQASANSSLAKIRSAQSTLNAQSVELSKQAIDISSQITSKSAELAAAEAKMADTTQLQAELDNLNSRYAENQKSQLDITAQLTDLANQAESLGAAADTSSLESQLTKATTDLSRLQSDLATKESEKSLAEGSILTSEAAAQLRATTNSEELSTMTTLELLDKAREGITADFNGIVTSVGAVEGATSGTIAGSTSVQGGELITIASLQDIKVNISVTKYDIERIEVGQKATVTALGNTYDGTVTRVSRLATANENGNNVFEAEITLSYPDDNIYIGADATVSVQGEVAENVVMVLSQAVNTSAEGDFCYVVRDSVVKKQLITTGIASNDYTQIKEGIKDGDIVVTSITEDIVEGASVTVNVEE